MRRKSFSVNWAFPVFVIVAIWFMVAGWVNWQTVLLIFLFGLELKSTWTYGG